MDGYIKIYRAIVDWEWFSEPATLSVFIYLLAIANHQNKKWHGMDIKIGQCITSQDSISRATGLTRQQVRTAISHLSATNEISVEATNKRSLITITKYVDYQMDNEEVSTNEQPSDNHKQEILYEDNKVILERDNIKNDNNKHNAGSKKNIKNNNIIYSEDFEKLWILYKRKGSKKSAYSYYIKLSDDEKSLLEQHIKAYVGSREVNYQKDFERYLKDKTFLTVVYAKNNSVIFDPEKISGTTKELYSPLTGQGIVWDEQHKCYHQIGMFQGFIIDGYNDDNRPDGALVSLSNAAGNAVWNKASKKWEVRKYD